MEDYKPGNKHCDSCIKMCPRCLRPSDNYNTNNRHIKECRACMRDRKRSVETVARERLNNACARCLISHPLQWDHINNDPLRDDSGRRKGSTLALEFAEIKRIAETGRSNRLQLLCPNCNWLKEFDPQEYHRPPTYGPSK